MTPNQADRDAAADWCEAQPFPSKQAEAPAIRAGEYDHHSLVQAFAAHRCAALEEALAQQPCTAENPNESDYELGRFDGIIAFARAIRALIDKEPT